MTLTLEVIAPQPATGASFQTFGPEGGTIGRGTSNALVLSNPKVSGRHAVISFHDGVFYIEDTSTNGTCLNSVRLARGQPYPLQSGDSLLIDPYELGVAVSEDESDASPFAPPARPVGGHQPYHPDPFGGEDPFAPSASPVIRPPELENQGLEPSRRELDPLALLDLESGPRPRQAPNVQSLEHGLPLDAHFQPPQVESQPVGPHRHEPVLIPEGYDPLAPDASQVAPPPPPVRPRPRRQAPIQELPPVPLPPPASAVPEPASFEVPSPRPAAVTPDVAPGGAVAGEVGGTSELSAVLAGAGLDPALATPELGRQLGQIFRVVVAGVMDIMESRSAIKDEMDLRRTRFMTAENNPLKFSANVDDALHNLLVKRNAAYLAPVAAFERAFDDVRNHQVAMLAGIQGAFEAMLAAFDPDRLEQEFDRQAGKGLVPAKMRYWDLYRERVHALAKDMDTSYRELFAKAFARAYAEKLERLKARAGASPPGTPDTGGGEA